MTSKEIVKAMTDRVPVVAKGIKYQRILEYVLTIDENGQQRRSATLLDYNNNCSVRVLIDQVEKA